jgi:hypothetical protein
MEPNNSLLYQMGWIINQVGAWNKYHTLRIMGIVLLDKQKESERKKISQYLNINRVEAEIEIFSIQEINEYENYQTFSEKELEMDGTEYIEYNEDVLEEDGKNNPLFSHFTFTNLKKLNRIILSNSIFTNLIFLPLPKIPNFSNHEKNLEFIETINVLSNELPPTLFLNSHEIVITTDYK